MIRGWTFLLWLAVVLMVGIAGLPREVSAYVDEVESELVTFSPYKPSYFVVGRPDSKAQVSFKLQPLQGVPVYLGYSQVLMWQLFKTSAPITDTDYNPELFYRLSWGEREDGHWLDLAPLEHESNGKSGANSRSWNRAYLRYSDTFQAGAGGDVKAEVMKVHWSLKAWIPFADESGKMSRYRGAGELTVTLSHFLGGTWKRGDLSLRLYPGGASTVNPIAGGQELTLRFKVREPHVLPLVVIQFFHGYGEDLLDYQVERMSLRAGLGF